MCDEDEEAETPPVGVLIDVPVIEGALVAEVGELLSKHDVSCDC